MVCLFMGLSPMWAYASLHAWVWVWVCISPCMGMGLYVREGVREHGVHCGPNPISLSF